MQSRIDVGKMSKTREMGKYCLEWDSIHFEQPTDER